MQDCYSVSSFSVKTILGDIDAGVFVVPEIQRPFVWDRSAVRDLIDSLYHGYPTGYLITWKNPTVRIKGGGTSAGKTILIDGQQRVTALMAAIAGKRVLNDDYELERIKIAFNPLADDEESPFAVQDASHLKDKKWIPDISELFQPGFSSFKFIGNYLEANPDTDPDLIDSRLSDLLNISARQMGVIDINERCTIDEVTEIFIRVNATGAKLSQADFAMSKIAADEEHNGPMLRKAIDYYCHLAVKPEFWSTIRDHDTEFMTTDFASQIEWLKDDKSDIFDPTYNDVLRVAFMDKFGRGKLADLVSLLSGRDFLERDFKFEIADESFASLSDGVSEFIKKENFNDFILGIRGAGFISPSLISSRGALDFAYTLYLRLRRDGDIQPVLVKHYVQKWFVMSILTGRYSGSSESIMDRDIRRIQERGFLQLRKEIEEAELSDTFWDVSLPQRLETTSVRSGAWLSYIAAQVNDGDNTLFNTGIKVSDVIETLGDVHHIFPKNYLKNEIGATPSIYNQVANYTFLEKRINIKIADDAPSTYFSEAQDCCKRGDRCLGGIDNMEELKENLADNCIPDDIFSMTANDYQDFLLRRRILIAQKIRSYYMSL